jgi:AcrR family transcriptional regulator
MGLFARHGFEQPTLDEVAKAAGVRKATLYSYFDSKSALIDAAVDQWLRELPSFCATGASLPVRQQLISIGLQLQQLAAHPVTVSLTERLAEKRLSPRQMAAWRSRYDGFEAGLAELLECHCDCESPRQVAQLFLLLAAGDLRPQCATLPSVDPSRIEGVVELILRAHPPCRSMAGN